MKKNYNIGLDIGTNSVGWAIVEENTQKVIKKSGKALWGVRLFDEADTAATRRNFRSTRRRYDRRRERIKLLREEFKNEIDSAFFQKLKESKYLENDNINKTIKLTNDEKIQIKEYNKKYPTIYHLRKSIIESKEKFDIKLVYLSIHHIIKYRGNFLYENSNFSVNSLNIKEKLCDVFNSILDLPTLNLPDNYQSLINLDNVVEILLKESKNDIKVELQKEFSNILPKEFIGEFIKMIVGNKFNFNKMLAIEENNQKIELSFKDPDYDTKYCEFSDMLGDNIEIMDSFKNLYDSLFLKKLFNGRNNTNLSDLMVEKYEEHKKDLALLKKLFRFNRKLYNQIFRTKEKYICLYDKYITNKITSEDFNKLLEKKIIELFDSNVIIDQNIIDEYVNNKYRISNEDFLPRITSTDNGKYPYQLNKDELIKIIENQGKYYPFLLNKTDNGIYKLVRLLEFKIPYYVGPLVSSNQSKFAWMKRKIENVKITPYNFDEVVDKEKTAEEFIKRMISHCTYLLDEYALPNNSILYSKFKVMNELKQIRINGSRMSISQQQNTIKDLFLKTSGTITNKKFIDYIRSTGEWDMYDNYNIIGYSADNKFANNMQSYIDFFGENGIFENTNYNINDAENIIEWITIFQDKDILENKVKNSYDKLNSSSINKIIKKSYSGWGKLSKKLLETKYYKDKTTENFKSILDIMSETDENFMQVLNNNEYIFQDMIKEYNNTKMDKKLDYKIVDNLATSPATKKGIYQALKVTEKLVKYMGYEPKNIAIEMSRGDEEKKRTDDRKKYLLDLYKLCKNDIENYNLLINQLNQKEKISSQKLFLYFIQEGKCLYSGEPLNIDDLDLYEIDHIIPRTLIKDDSIDNKALVYRECNQNKAANYILPREYRTEKNKMWWKKLKEKKLMSAKKFYNLIRNEYSEDDIEGFINRQLVETRQIIKHVANILGNFYENSKIIYLKAELSHNYRERYDLFKFREINDYHHAHDAYLAAVLGEYKEKYMKKKINFEMVKELNSKLRELGQYKKLKYGYVINSLDADASYIVNKISGNLIDEKTGEILFDAKKFNQTVEDTLYRNDILISKKTEIRTGEFFNQTKQKKSDKGIPLKKNMPIKDYGSYTSINPSYAVMINYTHKNKKSNRLVGFPIFLQNESKENIESYFRKLLKLKENDNLVISNKKVPFYSLINWNNQICYLIGASDRVEVCNALEFKYDKEFMKKNKYALNKLFNKKGNDMLADYEKKLDNIINYIVDSIDKKYVLFSNLIPELKQLINYDDYSIFTIEEKEKIIKELTKLLNCKSDNANFKFLNEKYSSAFGRKIVHIIDSIKISNKSYTGLKESTYEF